MEELNSLEKDREFPSVESLNAYLDSVAETRSIYDGTADWRGYRNLRVWDRAMDLAAAAYRLADDLPKTETHGLSSQIRRASASVAMNIAEGWGRNGQREFARFIDISVGSLCELETATELGCRLGLIERERVHRVGEASDHVGRMLHKLRSKLRQG